MLCLVMTYMVLDSSIYDADIWYGLPSSPAQAPDHSKRGTISESTCGTGSLCPCGCLIEYQFWSLRINMRLGPSW